MRFFKSCILIFVFYLRTMKIYQRVLYTSEVTDELKAKLRILCYNKRKSLKDNVFYVGFASETDAQYATKLANKLPNITMKPFQPKATQVTSPKPSAIRLPLSPELPSLPSTLTYLPPDWHLVHCRSLPDVYERGEEALLERGQRLLGLSPHVPPSSLVPGPHPKPLPPSASYVASKPVVRLVERHISPTDNFKRVLFDEIKSCLTAMDNARQATNEFCRFNGKNKLLIDIIILQDVSNTPEEL